MLDQRIESMIEFKQIVGRGTRIHEDAGKLWFTIIDFKKATELFADPDFDGEPEVIYEPGEGEPPVPPEPPEPPEPPPEPPPGTTKYVISGVEVSVLAERVQYYGTDGKLITESLTDYTKETVQRRDATLEDFLRRWTSSEKKAAIIDELRELGVMFEELREAVGKDLDAFDLICHIVYDRPPLTRRERAEKVKKQDVFTKYGEQARAVLDALLDKYAEEGLAPAEDLGVLRVQPLSDLGTPVQLVKHFGGKADYVAAVRELEAALYEDIAPTRKKRPPNVSLNTTIKSIQDIMRKDVGVDGDAQRIGQLVWLLFLKIWDDREQELALIEDDFASPLVDVAWQEGGETRTAHDLRWSAWAADPEGITGDKLLDFVNNILFPALKGMEVGPAVEGDDPEAVAARRLRNRRLLVRSVFEDAYQYMKSGTLLRQVINKVQADIDFNDATNRHLFGDLYEKILKDLQSAGNAGEYYTPRAVTQFAVDMIDPRLGESILDPACGTGGFLACAIEHIRKAEVQTPGQEALLQASVRGVEKKPLPHLLCVTNMIVHGIDVPTGIARDNTLARPLRDITMRDRVDVVVTNPPFGGMEEDGIESNFPAEFRTRETADLFLVLIMELLKPGGRAAVVLPDGTLFGEGVKTRIKERLLAECDLHTIVRLPKGVFAPYTSIKTNVLFFEKGRPTREVWYYEHPYPEGYKSYSKTKPMRIEEFEPEKAWWNDRVENEHAWKISIDEIRERGFNLDISNPNAPGTNHEDPDELLARYEKEKAAAAALREELRQALASALAGEAQS